MKKFTKNQGITLIALIITIIVMLILVAVTINVALNGGLFTRAKEAAFKTEIQQIQEQIALKKAEQAADNEINGTTGYNITLDSLDISTELKNKYRNKLSVSSTGDLQYNPDNCTNEEKAYLASIGAKSGTGTTPVVSNILEFDLGWTGEDLGEFDSAKYVFDDGNFYFYVEATDGSTEIKGNAYVGTYTYVTDTEDYKRGYITITEMYDDYDEENEEIVLETIPVEERENQYFEIYVVKNNGQIQNEILLPLDSGFGISTTNGSTGLNVPDSTLIGDYYNEDNSKNINISVNSSQKYGELRYNDGTNVRKDFVIINYGNQELMCVGYSGAYPIERGEEKITIEFNDVEYSKLNS